LARAVTIVKIGRRGSVVIPSEERRKAEIEEGDRVEVVARGPGPLVLRRVPKLKEAQKKMAGRLPQWRELEGKADELAEKEVKG